MELNKEHIRALLYEKVEGTISHADELLVNTAIENDEEIALMWKNIRDQMNDPDVRRFIGQLDEERSWEVVKGKLQHRNTRIKRYAPWRIAAAACVLGIALIFGYLSYNKKQAAVNPAAIPSAQNAPQLKMANGKDIYLSDAVKDTIAAGKVQLVSNGNQLTYTVPEGATDEWGTLVIPSRLDYRIVLKDGTEVWLNAVSSLRFPYIFQGNTREVYLTGEAYFKVAKNEQKPFIVHAGDASVKVLGTSFNINAYDAENIITALVDGAVISSVKGVSQKLSPGYQAVYEGGKFLTTPFDPNNTLSWMNGISNFHDMPLRDIALIISRWFDVKVVFDNPQLPGVTLSGGIDKNKPLEVFLTNISISSSIQWDLEEGVLHLK